MAVHSLHPDVHEFGLADNCNRCDEQARDLFTLDRGMLHDLARRECDNVPSRSTNEAIALSNIKMAKLLLKRCGFTVTFSGEV